MTDSDHPDAVISIRIVDIDYYMLPLDKFSPDVVFQAARLAMPDAHTVPKLPTVRIFGTTPAGQKACLHLHGIYPYFYIAVPPGEESKDIVGFCRRLRSALDTALTTSIASSYPEVGNQAVPSASAVFVADIEPVIRKSIYGFSLRPRLFLRISLFNPRMIQRLAAILYSGDGLPQEFAGLQPYESNMSFTLQVLTDYSLTGMGYINLAACTFRLPLPPVPPDGSGAARTGSIMSEPMHERYFTTGLLERHQDLFSHSAPKRARCEIELDAFASSILNARKSSEISVHGQMSGPDAFAAKTLKVLWDEEEKRTGKKPSAPKEAPRSVHAGHGLSEPRLASKLVSLLNGHAVASGGAAALDSASFEDVVDFLDGTDQVEKPENDEKISDDSSQGEADQDLEGDDWEDIRVCTQADGAPVSPIPQGDGTNKGDTRGGRQKRGRSISTNETGRQTLSRRRRVVGAYQPLTLGTEARGEVARRGLVSPSRRRGTPVNYMAGEVDVDLSKRVGRDSASISPVLGPYSRPVDAASEAPRSAREQDLQELNESGGQREFPRRMKSQVEREGIAGDDVVSKSEDEDDIGLVLDRERTGSPNEDGDSIVVGDDDSDGRSSEKSNGSVLSRTPQSAPGGDAIVGEGMVNEETKASCLDSPIGLSGRYQIVTPTEQAPSVEDVLKEFGPGGAKQSVIHTPPFYGNVKDAGGKIRPVAGSIRRIPLGGFAGLEPAAPVFDEDSEGTPVERQSFVLAFVKIPPSRDIVLADVNQRDMIGNRASTALQGGAGAKGHIDAAGRFVPGQGTRITQSATPVTYLSHPTKMPRARPLRRRIDNVADGNSDSSSEESEAEPEELLVEDMLVQTPGVTRPASPKYDERSFFPETPVRMKLQRAELSGSGQAADSPVLKRQGPERSKGVVASDGVSRASSHRQNLTVVVLEVLASCHGQRLPDPRIDTVLAVCLTLRDERLVESPSVDEQVVFLDRSALPPSYPSFGISTIGAYESESDLLNALAKTLQVKDPDIVCGFETQTSSIGFLLDRAQALEHDFARQISRILETDRRSEFGSRGGLGIGNSAPESAGARYFQRKGADVKIPGRHIVNLWRVVRKEVKLGSYSMEGVVHEVLNRTISKHTPAVLEKWFRSGTRTDRAVFHLMDKGNACLAIIDKLDILGRTGELARVYGIEFMSVLTRGSQYRVESMLARVAHPRGFVLLSAQRDQVFNQPAVECLPLVMEPLSDFYHDPVIVLDFQSLYPSMIIAHNLCFSTCMGNINRLSSWCDERQLGVVSGYRAPSAESMREGFGVNAKDGIFVAPNGEMFVTAPYRRGVLPQMLEEVLKTRVMVKQSMKTLSQGDDNCEELFKRMNARQFAAKMLANVTYGFAAASATGRMPCAGLADAIVQCGRDALERIVRFVEDELHDRTGAMVVYGDTDSLFVQVPGASRHEAFAVGRQITAQAESMFPAPIKLQLEKVYHPCILVTKKRYVGYSFPSENAPVPSFDAKGIETVRRDSCPLVQKTMERAIRTLFETRDISRVKSFFQSVCNRVQRNGVPLSEFIFRKEVRLGSYKKTLPPAAVVATKAVESDPRAAPRYGERVAFVVIFAGPGATLNNSVVSPAEMIDREASGSARIHTTYYISKQLVPSLSRLFSLVGLDVGSWYAELPRVYFQPLSIASSSRIPLYFAPVRPCFLCKEQSTGPAGVCETCRMDPQEKQSSFYVLSMRQRYLEGKAARLNQACIRCVGRVERDLEEIRCVSLDCPVRFSKHRVGLRDLRALLDGRDGWSPES